MTRFVSSLVLFLVGAVSLAAGPETWRVATLVDFLKGDLDQVSVDAHGRLALGPAIERIYDSGTPFVWTSVADPAGVLYLGTGNDGKVFKVDAAGRGTLFYDAPELQVHALAIAPDGGLYVGTSPDGRVYKVTSGGTATPLFDPDEKYIWALTVDRGGDLHVATGDPKGRVYRVTASGTGTPLHTSSATHVVSMTADRDGRLVIGTEAPGRVFRLEREGRAFLLLDTSLQEVRAIRADASGRLFVVAQARASADGGATETTTTPVEAPRALVPNVTVSITSMAVADTSTPTPAPTAPVGAVTGAIFRIDADGSSEKVYEVRDDVPYDVQPLADGAVLMATGHRGKIYRLEGEPFTATLVGRVPGRDAVRLVGVPGRTLVAMSNTGGLAQVSATSAERGHYVSEVKDAKSVARWGAISWRATTPAGTRVEVATRSGNSAAPDETWSDWSGPYTTAEGSPVTSPAARYLQWRVTLAGKGSSPVVTSLAAAYLQRNQRPVVTGLVVHPPGVVFQKPFSTGDTEIAGYRSEATEKRLSNQGQPPASTGAATLGRRTYQRGLQTFVWKGDDANGDALVFDVAFRREGDTAWTPLASELTDPIFVWDTTAVASGHYVVRVSASDTPTQPAESRLTGHAESGVIDIDAVPPTVTVTPGAAVGDRPSVAVSIRDLHSPVVAVEYALDGGEWHAAYPADGLLDSLTETLTLTFAASASGRSVVVRASDALHNVGVGHAVLR